MEITAHIHNKSTDPCYVQSDHFSKFDVSDLTILPCWYQNVLDNVKNASTINISIGLSSCTSLSNREKIARKSEAVFS